ncbi:hypothetical protein O181_049914 [Austropuccinia psidii MF-1]|uniref:DUF4219 domain-containing protein n=1 Tax=Austropuccinia psidii MF-1 TaxID=1389203 RepID=A0A9Q3DVR7_9BASI|nr:hypothetical protein [Austropuccinia psidii MF-1]
MNEKPLKIKEISNIPILDGTNYGYWKMRMKIYLRSGDLLDICEKFRTNEASTSSSNWWTKASFDSINVVTSRITERVFREIINSETIKNSHLLWSKTSEQYASQRAVNRGRVWMNWQRCFFDGNLQNYVDNFRKLMMELDAVSIVIPNELLSYLLLGKLGGNPHLSQFVETLIFNEDIIEKPLEYYPDPRIFPATKVIVATLKIKRRPAPQLSSLNMTNRIRSSSTVVKENTTDDALHIKKRSVG